MTRCVSPLLFADIASFLSARAGGRFRLIIGYETSENQDAARNGAAVTKASGGHALLMPRALPTPLMALSVRMVMADGAVYVRASGEALIYLDGRTIGRSHEGALAPDAELALVGEAVAMCGDSLSLLRSLEGWESVGGEVAGAYVDRCTSRIASLELSGARGTSVPIDEASGLPTTLLDHLGVPVVKEGTDLPLSVSSDGRILNTSVPEERVCSALGDALNTSPAVPIDPGLYCVDPAFVLDADALCAGAALAVLEVRDRTVVPRGHVPGALPSIPSAYTSKGVEMTMPPVSI